MYFPKTTQTNGTGPGEPVRPQPEPPSRPDIGEPVRPRPERPSSPDIGKPERPEPEKPTETPLEEKPNLKSA